MRTLFVTSTGTEIGKTYVTAALARHYKAKGERVTVLKPVLSGFDPNDFAGSDPAILLHALGETPTLAAVERVSPFRYRAPLAPNQAAAKEGSKVDFDAIVKCCEDAASADGDLLLIEGIGGLMVPLDDSRTVLDLIAALGAPILLVTGSYLGTISHTLTAVEAAKTRKLAVHAIVISESEGSTVPLEDTAAAIRRFTELPVATLTRGGSIQSLTDLL
jgi:dethiobiotin synthetase